MSRVLALACLAACTGPTVIATNQQVLSIAVDETNVYWTALDGLYRAPKDGTSATPTRLATLLTDVNSVTGVAVDDQYVYWVDTGTCDGSRPLDGAVMAMPIGGGAPITLADQQCAPQGIATDSDTVYWTTETSVLKVPKAGSAAATIATGESVPTAIVVDANNVYWSGKVGPVRMAAKSGGSAVTIDDAQGLVNGLVVDATFVYFAEVDGDSGTITKVPLAGGAPVVVAADDYKPSWVAVDDAYVYWTDETQIRRTTLDGTSTETLADGEFYPTALAIDDTYVYWGNQRDDLKRIAK